MKRALTFALLLLIVPLIRLDAQPRGPRISVVIDESLRAHVKAELIRVIHHSESIYLSNKLKIPLMPWLHYKGNVTAKNEGGRLTGTYQVLVIPRPGQAKVRALFFPNIRARGLLTNVTVYGMMKFLYGSSLTYYGLNWYFVNVTYQVSPNINYTGIAGVVTLSDPDSYIDTLNVSFDSFNEPDENTLVIRYTIDAVSVPLKLQEAEEGYLTLDLSPVLKIIPDDVAGVLQVNFTDPSIEVLGGVPAPKLTLWNSATWEYVPQLQDTGKGVVVIVKKPGAVINPSYLLSFILPVVVGTYLYWRREYEAKSKGVKEKGQSKG